MTTDTPMRGFTLIEILLVVAATGIIAAGGVRLSRALLQDAAGEDAARATVTAFRDAQRRSVDLVHDAPWGVHVTSASAVVFEGDAWDMRVTDSDAGIPFSRIASTSDVTDIIFAKGSFEPDAAATLSFPFDDEVWRVVIGSDGMFSYGPSF